MKDLRVLRRPFRHAIFYVACLGLVASTPFLGAKEKLTPEQLIALHLESIGSQEARTNMETLRISGTVAAIPRRGGSGRLDGSLGVLSDLASGQSLIDMEFGQPSYPFERIGFDGESAEISQLSPGTRSALGELLNIQNRPITEGLLGGVLTLNWPLFNIEEANPKLKYKGLKKVDGEKLHSLEYKPRKSTEFRIRILFEPETYRHVKTEYSLTLSARSVRMGSGSSTAQEKRFKLVESFSDFREEGTLTLPHGYNIRLTVEENSTLIIDWEMQLEHFEFNSTLEPSMFLVVR